MSDKIGWAFNMVAFGATRAVAVDISKAFDRVWYAGPLYKPRSYFRSCTFSTIN